MYGGLLCTIDLRNDPIGTYEALLAFGPPAIDFLLPHGTWDAPPPGRTREAHATPYAEWLITIFDHWYAAPYASVRLFEEIIRLTLTGESAGEGVGLAPSTLVVIETDGSIEQLDSLKAAYNGATATGLHVTTDTLDAALLLPSTAARQIGARALATHCQSCDIHQVCGGGLYTHRYRSGSGFANPSVYCPDLMRLITHVSSAGESGLHRPEAWGALLRPPLHELSRRALTALAAGEGDAAAIAELTAAELSKHRLLDQ